MDIKIFYKPIKNPILRVTPNLKVTLSMPLNGTQQEINYILEKRKKWIEKNLQFFKSRQTPPRQLVSGEDFFYLGKRYRLKVIKNSKEYAILKGGYLQVFIKDPNNYRTKQAVIQEWYRQKAKYLFNALLVQYGKILGLHCKSFSIRTMKTRWGSCRIDKAHITLNLELIKKPKLAIEYVVLHELAHLKHPYHNQDFYNFLDLYMPNWKTIKTKLEEFN